MRGSIAHSEVRFPRYPAGMPRLHFSPFRRPLLGAAAALASLLAGPVAFAWGPNGHRAAGAIAYTYLSPEARKAVDDLLAGQSLADASNWADEIRKDPSYDWVKPLHYVNIPRGADRVDMARDCAKGECILGAITKYKGVLKDPASTREQRIEALKLLAHFIEDIHQPLHASYADDKGGNMISVKLFGKKTSLHALWDSGMIDSRLGGASWDKWAESVRGKINAETLRKWRASNDPVDWANESVTITKSLYGGLPANGEIGQPYINANFNTVEERIAAAGVRLAAALNEVYGGTAPDAVGAGGGATQGAGTAAGKAGQGSKSGAPAKTATPAKGAPPATAPKNPASTTNKQKQATPAMHTAAGSFDVTLTPQTGDAQPADTKLGRMTIEKQFHGDLEATSKGQMLSAGTGTEGSAGYVAIEQVSGTLGGRTGTFVLQHSGTMNRGAAELIVSVVPDSGTGELAGLVGTMKIIVAGGKHSYEFEYLINGGH